MDSLYVKAAFAGFFFALWPMAMNRSGLPGLVSGFALVAGVAAILGPLAWYTGRGTDWSGVAWSMVAAACVTCALGNICFNTALARVTPANLGTMFLMMVLTQIVTSAVVSAVVTQQVTLAKAAGFVCACLAAYLLR